MSEQQIAIATPNAVAKPVTLANLLSGDKVKQRFNEILGKKAPGFISSVLSVANNNALLKKAKPQSVLNAAVIAATLDLPINPSLGHAYIVPYGDDAQFIIGWKGLVQLAMRSGQYLSIGAKKVCEGELEIQNSLLDQFKYGVKKSDKGIGYFAYFKLMNGFEKCLYITKEEAEAHGKKYSQTYKRGKGVWVTDFDAMAKKTVLKMLISQWGPLSIEMQRAQIFDQAVVRNDLTEVEDIDSAEIAYVDNETTKSRLKDIASANVVETEVIEVVDETTGEVMSEEQPMSDELPFD